MRHGQSAHCWGIRGLVSVILFPFGIASAAEPAAKPVDPAAPVEHTVFKAGEKGYHAFRIPAVVVTKQGAIMAICEGRKASRADDGDIDLVSKQSLDGGKTWSELQVIHEEGGDKPITIGNPAPVVDQKDGVIWLAFTRNNDRVFITHSENEGETWAEPKEITKEVKAEDWTWYATGPVNGIQLTAGPHAGRLLIPCDHRVAKGEWQASGRSHMIYSDDHGASWKRGEPTEYAMNECTVAELPQGQVLLNMRSYRKQGCRAVAVSKDGGESWSECVDEPALPEPVCQGALLRYSWSDQGEKSRLLFSNPATAKSRDHLTVRVSYDEGKTWPVSRVLCEGSAAYSCLSRLPDDRVGVLYERDNYQQIAFATFSLPWLSAGKDPGPAVAVPQEK